VLSASQTEASLCGLREAAARETECLVHLEVKLVCVG
jgi:hypothetical protein